MDTAPLPPVGGHGTDPRFDPPTEPLEPAEPRGPRPLGPRLPDPRPLGPRMQDPRLQAPPTDPAASGEPGRPPPPGPALRVLEVVAGLASGGLLVVGLALVVLQLLAPEIAPGTGLAAPSGPGWARAGAQFGVGLAGELVVLARRWCPRPVRAVLAAAVIVAAAAVLWLAWWA